MNLHEEWKKYRDALYPQGISGIQNRETHQAFFAGAFMAVKAMEATVGMTDDEAVAFLKPVIRDAKQMMEQINQNMKDRN